MFGFISKWSTASKVGLFMHQLTNYYGSPISEDACHSIVKAYGWRNSKNLMDVLCRSKNPNDACEDVCKEICLDVYGKHLGSHYAQEWAGAFLIIAHVIDHSNPVGDSLAAQRYIKECALMDEVERYQASRTSSQN